VDVRPAFPLPDVTWEPAREFWNAAARGELSIPKCDGCGRLCWYPRERCARLMMKGLGTPQGWAGPDAEDWKTIEFLL
jgi:hypothetical protein